MVKIGQKLVRIGQKKSEYFRIRIFWIGYMPLQGFYSSILYVNFHSKMQKTVLPCSPAVGRKIPSLKVYELMFVVGAKNICCFWCSKQNFLVEFMLQMTLGEVESTSNSSFLQSLNLFREELGKASKKKSIFLGKSP